MNFPQRLHEVIQDPGKEAKVMDLIRDECMKEYVRWRDSGGHIEAGAIGAAANLLCAFTGVPTTED